MIIIDFGHEMKNTPVVIGLGYFDSVHKGHVSLIDKVKEEARRYNAKPCIFTFSNNPFESLNSDVKSIFSIEERIERLKNLGVEVVICANADKEFMSMRGEEFLDVLRSNYDIKGFVSGSDYRYGIRAESDTEELHKYGLKNGIEVFTVDLMKLSGRKIASRDIRQLIKDGEIEKVNELLSEPYSVSGIVVKGRQDGRKMGFPTANINISSDRFVTVKDGVYSSIVIYRGVRYKGVTNVGNHPTFNDEYANIETHIIGFDKEIYGENIKVIFVGRIRDVRKFNSTDELATQIASDKQYADKEVKLS